MRLGLVIVRAQVGTYQSINFLTAKPSDMDGEKIVRFPERRREEAPKRLKDFHSPLEYKKYVDARIAKMSADHDNTLAHYMKELSAESILNLMRWSQTREVDPEYALKMVRGHLTYLLGNSSKDNEFVSDL